MRSGLARTPFSTWARRGLLVVVVSIGLVVAWSYTGFASLITDYTIGDDGVVRSDAAPTSTPTPAYMPQPTTAQNSGNTSTARTVAKAKPTSAPPKSVTRAKSSYGTASDSPYAVTKERNVFTVSRNGKPWVVLTQGSGSIIVSDPSRTSRGVVDITLAKPGLKYTETR
jgi:hypothetical protein